MAIVEVLWMVKEKNAKVEKEFTYLLETTIKNAKNECFEVDYKSEKRYDNFGRMIDEKEGRLLKVLFKNLDTRKYLRIESNLVYEDGLELITTASDIVSLYIKERLENTEQDNAFWTIESNNEYLMAIVLEKLNMVNSDFLISTKEEVEVEGKSYVEEVTSRSFFTKTIGAAKNIVSFVKSLKNEMEKSDELYFKEWEFSGSLGILEINARFLHKGIEYKCRTALYSNTECLVSFKLYDMRLVLDVLDEVNSRRFNLKNQSFDTLFKQYLKNNKLLFTIKNINKQLTIHNIFREVFKYAKRGAESFHLFINEEEFLKETSLLGIDNVPFFTEVLKRVKNQELKLSDVYVSQNENGGDLVNVGFMGYNFYFEAESEVETLTKFEIRAGSSQLDII